MKPSVSGVKIEVLENRRLMAAVARINVGGPDLTDSTGNFWQADNFAAGGTAINDSIPVANTPDPAIYQSRREGSAFSYSIPVPNGDIFFKLRFVESTFQQPGQRVETIFAEGAVHFFQLDVFQFAGFQNALELQSSVHVTDGQLDLNFTSQAGFATLSGIQVFTKPTIAIDKSIFYFNSVSGSGPSAGQIVTVTNTGTEGMHLLGIQPAGGTDPSLFAVTGATGGDGYLVPTQSTQYTVYFNPPAGTSAGIKTSNIQFITDDPARPAVYLPLRAIATPGEGGANEPSLQRIFTLYNIGTRTGDLDSASTQLYNKDRPVSPNNDEVVAQLLTKAGTGPVTIEPLAVFGLASQPALYLNWYAGTNVDDTHQLFRVPPRAAQTVNVETNGSLTFDPGAIEFGFSTNWPGLSDGSNLLTSRQRTIYQSDVFNTGEKNAYDRRKVRFYPLKNADGSVVPNAYIFAIEETNNESSRSYDYQDLVAVVRNVHPVTPGRLTLSNLEGPGTFNNQVVFNNILTHKGTNVTKTTAVLRLNNTGGSAITLNDIFVPAGYTQTNPPSAGTVITAGGFLDLTLNFTSTTVGDRYSTMIIYTNDAARPIVNVSLRGKLTQVPEHGEEPTFRKVVNEIFGYKTNVGSQTQFTSANGAAIKIGDEVLSTLWQQADAGKRIYVRQLTAYHTADHVSQFYWFPESNPNYINSPNTPLFTQARTDSQSLLPRKTTTGNPPAEAYFDMGPDAVFGFAMRDGSGSSVAYYSVDTLNDGKVGAPDQHLFRFFPAKDQNNIVIPDTYFLGVDYNGVNYDYQDGVFLISNIRPKDIPSSVRGVGLQQTTPGVVLNWAANLETNIIGYNVYRSTSAGTSLVKRNASLILGTTYTDSSPPIGQRVYYYVTAVNSLGKSSLVETESIFTA